MLKKINATKELAGYLQIENSPALNRIIFKCDDDILLKFVL